MFFRIPPAVKNLLIINVIFFLATWALPVYNIDLDKYFALYFYESPNFHPYQYITYMFMHANFWHILFNMYALFMFGVALERVWGSKRFLIFYFVTGIGAALIHTFVNYLHFAPMITDSHAFMNTPSPELLRSFIKDYAPHLTKDYIDAINRWAEMPKDPQLTESAITLVNNIANSVINIPTVGASGAVFGVLLGFGMLFPNTELMLLFPPIPIKAKYFVMIYGGIELYLGATQPGSNIAHFAHLGGMIFGFFLIKLWNKDRNNFY
jgi:membrane associated rhomboid family serine protease